MHHELAAYLRLRWIQVGVASDLACRGDDEITACPRPVGVVAVVAQMQQHVLGQRCDPIGPGGEVGQLQDGGDLRRIQVHADPLTPWRPFGHRAAVAACTPAS
jgi:hypothetical protein